MSKECKHKNGRKRKGKKNTDFWNEILWIAIIKETEKEEKKDKVANAVS